jgi:hypothetical protein
MSQRRAKRTVVRQTETEVKDLISKLQQVNKALEGEVSSVLEEITQRLHALEKRVERIETEHGQGPREAAENGSGDLAPDDSGGAGPGDRGPEGPVDGEVPREDVPSSGLPAGQG